jgi:HAMP domain-containing protein
LIYKETMHRATQERESSNPNSPPNSPPKLQKPVRKRLGLSAKTILTTVLPVFILGIFVVLLLTLQRVNTLETLGRTLADSVVRILATTLDVQDLTLVNTQLQAAVSSENVAFVDVRPSGAAVRFFTSKDPNTDWSLLRLYDQFLKETPGSRHFKYTDTRAAQYRQILQQSRAGNTGARKDVQEHLQDALNRLTPLEGQVTDLQVIEVEVYVTPAGARNVRFVGEARPAGEKLFDLGIGVIDKSVRDLLDAQLGSILLLTALALLGTLALAVWFGRRLVRPVLALTAAVNHISLGKMDAPMPQQDGDELADLAESVDRLRVSLVMALNRLRPKGPL